MKGKFVFKHPGHVALGCTLEIDGQEIGCNCTRIIIDSEVGQYPKITLFGKNMDKIKWPENITVTQADDYKELSAWLPEVELEFDKIICFQVVDKIETKKVENAN